MKRDWEDLKDILYKRISEGNLLKYKIRLDIGIRKINKKLANKINKNTIIQK